MNCKICNSNLDNSFENISVCFSCGQIEFINNIKIDLNTKKEKIDTLLKEKKYDYLLLELLNIYAGDNSNVEIIKQIINCYLLYGNDNSEVYNHYIFKDEYKLQILEKALKLDLSISDREFLTLSYQEMLKELIKQNSEKINCVKEDINKCKLELEKTNSEKEYVKPKWLEKVLIASILLLISGLVFSFAIDNKICKYIGLFLLFLGIVSVLVVSIFMPTTNSTKKKSILNKRLSNDNEILEDLNATSKEIQAKLEKNK